LRHLFINKNLTINGSGTGAAIIEQTNPLFRVIDIGNFGGSAPVVSISRLTIKGGQATTPSNSDAFPGHTHGGGIHNHGILTLTNVTFTGNSSTPANDLGGGGRDLIFGEDGNHILAGEGGNDTLTGGLGADRFRGGSGTDTATDFTPAQGDIKFGVENF
jgi:Ca2+-binding RTX toxin-like protein